LEPSLAIAASFPELFPRLWLQVQQYAGIAKWSFGVYKVSQTI
jgi:hypothetical protein